MVIALGHPGFTQIEIEFERGLEGLPRLLPEGDRWLKIRRVIAARIHVCKKRPGKRELRIQSDRFSKIRLCAKVVSGRILGFYGISETTKVSIVSFGIVCRFRRDDLFFPAREMHLQLVGDSFGDLTLDRKNVSQFAIKAIGPKM